MSDGDTLGFVAEDAVLGLEELDDAGELGTGRNAFLGRGKDEVLKVSRTVRLLISGPSCCSQIGRV